MIPRKLTQCCSKFPATIRRGASLARVCQKSKMPHETPLIATIVAGLGLAFVFGTIAHRFRIQPLVGYLLAGVAVGPFTPGFVADQALATELAELGIILLMFGVGLHFSLCDLRSVSAIAVPGAIVQIAVATLMGLAVAMLMGWTVSGGLVFGLALSVASTVVLLRALQERRLMETERGRIAVGWLIVEDLAMVLALVLLPALASLQGGRGEMLTSDPLAARLGLGVTGVLLLTLVKIGVFVGLMLLVGRKLIPAVFHYIAHTGSRELFRLAVLATALCIAFGATKLFNVSLALGAFFAGMMLRESPLSQRAAQESLPLRDAFAVLFFVSVGMPSWSMRARIFSNDPGGTGSPSAPSSGVSFFCQPSASLLNPASASTALRSPPRSSPRAYSADDEESGRLSFDIG